VNKDDLKRYIVDEFLPGEDGADLSDELDLIDAGILDSLGVLKLVAFLERSGDVLIEPEEMDADRFRTIASIVGLVGAKQGGTAAP
jgi:acyl carrier protein